MKTFKEFIFEEGATSTRLADVSRQRMDSRRDFSVLPQGHPSLSVLMNLQKNAEQRAKDPRMSAAAERHGIEEEKKMKTFSQFLFETTTTQRLKLRAAQLVGIHQNDPEKLKIYKNLLNKIREREKPTYPDYPGRESARRDKHFHPSGRMSSHPEEDNPETKTKNPKKLRKQKAIGEINK